MESPCVESRVSSLESERVGRKRPEADGDGDSLLSNAEIAAGVVSSILRDSNPKRSGALPIKEALDLSLQGVAFVSPRVLLCLILSLSCVLILCWVLASGYPSEEFSKKG